MQKHKPRFQDSSITHSTIADVQRCLRLNDLAEISDDRHHLVFHMLGLFSFRDWSVQQAIGFWYAFLSHLQVPLTHVTVHPDRLQQWSKWHQPYGLPIVVDPECVWSDGGMGGYCTEFFVGEIEVGNIVNPMGTCIDVGFGLERLEQVTGTVRRQTSTERLVYTLDVLAESGVVPGPKAQSYVMRRLVRTLVGEGDTWDHPLFEREIERHAQQVKLYHRLKKRHCDKSEAWWWDTHGITVTDMT